MPSTCRRAAVPAVAVVLALSGALAACGDDDGDATTATAPAAASAPATDAGAGAFPVTIPAANGNVTIAAAPQRIVSLSAAATESLFAIGAGPQVVAVDDQSNFPPEAPHTDLSGYQPNVEAITGYDPDLVVAFYDPGGLVEGLTAVKVPILVLEAPTMIDGAYTQIEQLGAATGHVAEAAGVVADMQGDIQAIVDRLPARDTPLTYYHELDQSFFSVTSQTFIGQVYGLLGLENIADAADAGGASGGYPQLSSEYIVAADPDLIFLADTKCCAQSADTVAARPGWGSLTAVTTGGVVALDDDVASRWGPRIVDLLDTVAQRVAQVAPAGS